MQVRIGIVAVAALITAACAEEPPAGPPFRTETSVSMLMAHMLDPAADLLWDAVGTVIDENGNTIASDLDFVGRPLFPEDVERYKRRAEELAAELDIVYEPTETVFR